MCWCWLQVTHRGQLDNQMQERDGLRAQEEADKQLEKKTLESEVGTTGGVGWPGLTGSTMRP